MSTTTHTTASALSATPTKLRSGSWGAKVRGAVERGDTVTITTRSGKSWQARVERVLWSGEGVSICATQSLDRPQSRSTRRRQWWEDDGCHTGGDCSSMCDPRTCPCGDGSWFSCC